MHYVPRGFKAERDDCRINAALAAEGCDFAGYRLFSNLFSPYATNLARLRRDTEQLCARIKQQPIRLFKSQQIFMAQIQLQDGVPGVRGPMAFCRYIDRLATWAPDDESIYRQV